MGRRENTCLGRTRELLGVLTTAVKESRIRWAKTDEDEVLLGEVNHEIAEAIHKLDMGDPWAGIWHSNMAWMKFGQFGGRTGAGESLMLRVQRSADQRKKDKTRARKHKGQTKLFEGGDLLEGCEVFDP